MNLRVKPSTVRGRVVLPGDKSIGHRALMLASLARGRSSLANVSIGEDVAATAECLRRLGIQIDRTSDRVLVQSDGNLREPPSHLYAANSGTTMRLLLGLLAAQPFSSCLTGDPSLSRRPMRRVIEPLRSMGAHIQAVDGHAPLQIQGRRLHGATHILPIASAQVKSALLLAGLFADGETVVEEPSVTRDHTERMLGSLGISVVRENNRIRIRGGRRPTPFTLTVPGDISSASFFFAAAALTGGEVTAEGIGVNPTRIAFLHVLQRMGLHVQIEPVGKRLGEPVADVTVSGSPRESISIDAREVPVLIDELPLVALLATQASGSSIVSDAQELRVKESDRIMAVTQVLEVFGAHVVEKSDGFTITGPTTLRGARAPSFGDHRIAMMAAVAGLAADGETVVENAEACSVSFPDFAIRMRGLGGDIRDS